MIQFICSFISAVSSPFHTSIFFVRAKKLWASSLCYVNPDPYRDSLVPHTIEELSPRYSLPVPHTNLTLSPRYNLPKNRHALYGYAGSINRSVALAAIIILTACNATPKNKQAITGTNTIQYKLPAPTPLSPADSLRLHTACEAWYNSVLKARGFNGGMAVAKNGHIIFEAYNGSVHPGGPDIMTDSTSLHIASVSKTFTAMATLKLWQDGKLNIDDEYSKYFPAFNYPGVTIRNLLSHRSGLPNYVHFMENMGWDKKVNATNEEVLNFLITRKADLANIGLPNRSFTYCNTNFALLALLIEKASGKKYADYLQQTFFTPLQMKHTFVYNNADSGKVAMSYDYRGRMIPFNFLDMVYGDKNIYSTPRDLLTWDRALTSGLIFTPQTLAEAYTPYSNEKRGIRNYGLGWRMNNYPSGKKMIYHNGWWHGNNAAFVRLLQDSATIVVLGNKENHNIYHAKDLSNLFGNYFGDTGEDETEGFKSAVPAAKPLPRINRPSKARRSLKKLAPPTRSAIKRQLHPAKRRRGK